MSDNKISLFAYSKNRSIFSDCSLIELFKCISELQAPGFVNVGFQDIVSVLGNCNYAVITSTIGEGSNRMADAISMISSSSLWEEYNLKSAEKIILKLLCSRDSNPIIIKEISELIKFSSNLSPSIDLKWGIGEDSILGDKIKLILLGVFKKKRVVL